MIWRLFLFSGLAVACSRAPDSAPTVASAASPLSAAPALRVPPGELLLDAMGDRVLLARVVTPPPNADPPLRLTARLEQAGRPAPWRYDGVPIGGARLFDGGAFVITERGELREVPSEGTEQVLDTEVVGAIGATTDGASVVYARGEPPSLEISRYDRGAGPRRLTTDFAPAWSPGVSPDGRTVYFVSARTGVPAWWRLRDGEPAEQLTNRDVRFEPGVAPTLSPFASGLGPTLVSDELVVFESETGVVAMTPSGAIRETWDAASLPHWVQAGRTLGMVVDGQLVRHSAPGVRP